MIEIKCDELQKEAIKSALLNSDYCVVANGSCKNQSCSKCLDKNIKWVIRGASDA